MDEWINIDIKMTRKLFKRGISPIIATMLLIALAVSVGATVMSFGGIYYEERRLKDGDCSEILISAFEVEDKKQCEGYQIASLINFYSPDETVIDPKCYKEVATGKWDACVAPEPFLGSSWAPIGNIIK